MASVTSFNRQLIFMLGVLILYLALITLMMSMVLVAARGEEFTTSYRNKDFIIVKDNGGYIREYITRYRDHLKDTHACATRPARWCLVIGMSASPTGLCSASMPHRLRPAPS
jgi:hypothetical protein